jgi:hypothetical protein
MRFRRCDPFARGVVAMNVESVMDSGVHYRSICSTTECLNRTAETSTARSVRRVSDFVLVGNPESVASFPALILSRVCNPSSTSVPFIERDGFSAANASDTPGYT